jgi:hypothetical protein
MCDIHIFTQKKKTIIGINPHNLKHNLDLQWFPLTRSSPRSSLVILHFPQFCLCIQI